MVAGWQRRVLAVSRRVGGVALRLGALERRGVAEPGRDRVRGVRDLRVLLRRDEGKAARAVRCSRQLPPVGVIGRDVVYVLGRLLKGSKGLD